LLLPKQVLTAIQVQQPLSHTVTDSSAAYFPLPPLHSLPPLPSHKSYSCLYSTACTEEGDEGYAKNDGDFCCLHLAWVQVHPGGGLLQTWVCDAHHETPLSSAEGRVCY